MAWRIEGHGADSATSVVTGLREVIQSYGQARKDDRLLLVTPAEQGRRSRGWDGRLRAHPPGRGAEALADSSALEYRVGTIADDSDVYAIEMMRVLYVVALCAEAQGRGVLLHGALAERDGQGVILAAPGGTGKTTASNRLPPPWRSLCDDTALVLRDDAGELWAHPWPTWSRFFFGGSGGSWDVQEAVPLRAVFFLEQASHERVEALGRAEAACSLSQSTEQAGLSGLRHLLDDRQQADHRLRRFDLVCALARAVPAYRLELSLSGAFWREMERVMRVEVAP